MENPLKKYHIISVIIIFIYKSRSSEIMKMWDNSVDKIAWRIWDILKVKDSQLQNIAVIIGDDILSEEEIEAIKAIGKKYYDRGVKEKP